MTFGESLKRILKDKRKSQKELADLIDVDYGYLSRIIGDKTDFTPSTNFILNIVDKLGCSEEDKNDLLKEAGRFDKEIEQIAKETADRPKLQTLFKSAPKLDEEQLDAINKRIQDILHPKPKK